MSTLKRGCNPSKVEQFQIKRKKENDDFKKRLSDFPHTFQLGDLTGVKQSTFRCLKKHLEEALKAGYKTDVETAQSLNLLAYTLFRLDNREAALGRVEEALQMESQRRNLVSLANKAVFLWDTPARRDAAKRIASQLESLREEEDFVYLQVKARAELASNYMRFGPNFVDKAVAIFNEVIPEGREPEIWNWKLGLATALRQTLSLQYAAYTSDEVEHDKHFKIITKLQEITDGPASQDLKANAYVEIAMVLLSTWDTETYQSLCDAAKTGLLKACKEALKCDGEEPSVLWKAGKCFRYYKDVHKSLELLLKAVELQPSSAAYHNLGLTYKAFATEDKRGTLRRRRGKRREGRRRGKKSQKQKKKHEGEGGMSGDRHGGGDEEADAMRPETVQSTSAREGRNVGRGRDKRPLGGEASTAPAGAERRGRGSRSSYEARVSGHKEMPVARGHAHRNEGQYPDTNGAAGGCDYDVSDFSVQMQDRPGSAQRGRGVPRGRGRGQGKGMRPPSQHMEHQPGQGTHDSQDSDNSTSPRNSAEQTQLKTYAGSCAGCPGTESSFSEQAEARTRQNTQHSHSLLHDDEEDAASSDNDGNIDTQEGNGRLSNRLSKAIKSPPEGTIEFIWEDKYVKEAIVNLKKAVDFSEKENARAMYDLALMYKALREFDEALSCLETIYDKHGDEKSSAGVLEVVTAFEQAGLIKREMAEKEGDPEKKTNLQAEADWLLQNALTTASDLFSNSAEMAGKFAIVFQSPRALFRAVNNSDKSTQEKQKEKAKLLQLIQKHPKSLAVLRKMSESNPESEQDAEYHTLFIRNLYQLRKFGEAVTSLELLTTTQLGEEVRENLGMDFVQDMYLQAGQQELHNPASNTNLYFSKAFALSRRHTSAAEGAAGCSQTTNSNTDSGSTNSGSKIPHAPGFNIVILHEEEGKEMQEKAAILTKILRHKCGLKVTKMDDDVPLGSQGAMEILNIIDESDLLVVLVGKDEISELLEFQVNATVTSNVPVAVLRVNGAPIPHVLRGHRSMVIPPELLQVQPARYSDGEASRITELFKFLCDVR